MKNKSVFIFLVLLISSILFGCNWTVPKNVSVKTNASYSFSAGNAEMPLDKYLDVASMVGDLPHGVKLYDYFPGEKDADVQRYLLQVPLADIPLDLDGLMAQIDLTSQLKAIEFSKDFTVPKISMDAISVPLKGALSELSKVLNKALIGGSQAISGNLYAMNQLKETIELTDVLYNSGTLVVKAVEIPGSPIALPDGSKISVQFDNIKREATVTNGVAKVDLTGVILNPNKATFTWSGLPGPIPFMATISDDANVAKFNGLTIKENGQPQKITIPELAFELPDVLPAESGLKKIAVKQGNLRINVAGFAPQPDITLTSTGGLALVKGGEKIDGAISLADATFVPGVSNVKATVSVELNNLSVDLTNTKLEVKPEINEIKTITADIGQAVSFEQSFPLPSEMAAMITSIGIAPSGVEVEYTNTLPAGNDITLSATSNFLGLKGNVPFKANTVNGTGKLLSADKTITISDSTAIDFSVNVGLPGSTKENPTLITISNVRLGETYNLGVKLNPILEWKTVSVNPSALNNMTTSLQNQTVDLGVDLYKTINDFGNQLGGAGAELIKNIEISSLPVYLAFTKPAGVSAFNNLSFGGEASLNAVTAEKTTPLQVILDSKNPLKPVDALPTITLKDNKIVTSDLSTENVSLKLNLADAAKKIVKTPGKLQLDYSLNIGGINSSESSITIKKSELKGSANIAVVAYIDLGLALNLARPVDSTKNGVYVDLLQMDQLKDVLTGKDLLQGNGKVVAEQKDYINLIKELSVICNLKELPLHMDGDLALDINFKNVKNENQFNPADLVIGSGKDLKITLTNAMVTDIIDAADPVLQIEKMGFTIPYGTFSIPRKKSVGANLSVKLVTDGSVPIMKNGQMAFGGTK